MVAPSGGGVLDIYTTDVSIPGRGYNPAPMPAGAHTDTFSGTSSATPLAAGVAALIIDANPKLTRDEVRDVLESTAEKIGDGYSTRGATAGHSSKFGYGRVDAQAAVAEAKRPPPLTLERSSRVGQAEPRCLIVNERPAAEPCETMVDVMLCANFLANG